MEHHILDTTIVVLFTVLLVNLTFRFIRLPVILGYLVVGVLVGPHVLGWISDAEAIRPLAEFGVVFLMFTIGLDFSLPKLISLKFPVFVLGGLQVILSILISVGLGLLLGMSLTATVIVGCVVSMSSTALVVKILSDQRETQSRYGLNAIGILLFQDLAVIPILIIIASLSGLSDEPIYHTLMVALLKGILAILVIIGIGRWLLRPIFHLIAAARIAELFTLSVLFIAIASAWLTAQLGMTLILGAFFSGIMLGETQFRHQIKIEIRPFKDILLGLFFVSIGMLANISIWGDIWPWILLLLMGIMIGKTALIIGLCKLSKESMINSTRTGLTLGQGGEFGFAIFAVARSAKLLPTAYNQAILAALLISFALAPMIIRYNGQIARFFFPEKKSSNEDLPEPPVETNGLSNHVIICGFGRVGQNIAQFLRKTDIPYIAFDLDPDIIKKTNLAGEPTLYGNVTHPELIKAANIHKARAIVISFQDVSAAIHILTHIQQLNVKIPALVRCKDQADYELLRQHGATKIVTEAFEESLSLLNYLFQILDIPREKIVDLLQEEREIDPQMLSRIFPESFREYHFNSSDLHSTQIRAVVLPGQSQPLAKSITTLKFQEVEVVCILRKKKPLLDESAPLQEGDIVFLEGNKTNLDKAEKTLTSINH